MGLTRAPNGLPLVTLPWSPRESNDLLVKIALAEEEEKALAKLAEEKAERQANLDAWMKEHRASEDRIKSLKGKTRLWIEENQRRKAMRRSIKW